MGRYGVWFMCNEIKELKDKKEKLLAEVKAIDEKIAELESKVEG